MDTECPHVACQPRGRALYPRLCLIYCSQWLHELVITTFTEQRRNGPRESYNLPRVTQLLRSGAGRRAKALHFQTTEPAEH